MLEDIDAYKKYIGVENKNYCVALVESKQICKHCQATMPIGSNCISMSHRYHRNVWMCDTCLQLKLNICNSRLRYGLTPNGDISGDIATLEEIKRLTKEHENRAFMNDVHEIT